MSSLIQPFDISLTPDQTRQLITHGPTSVDPNLTAGMMKNATKVVFLDADGNEITPSCVITIDPAFRKSAAAGRKKAAEKTDAETK